MRPWAKAEGGANRYDKIVAMIEESEKLKSGTENRAFAYRPTVWCRGALPVRWLPVALTRNVTPGHLHPDGGLLLCAEAFMPLAVLSPCGSAGNITSP